MTGFKFFTSTEYPTAMDLDRAYLVGFNHYQGGYGRSYNPYLNEQMYERWIQGWRWAHLIDVTNTISEINETV